MATKKFTVSVTRDITEECVVVVSAKNRKEAMELALDKANNAATDEIEWRTTDWTGDCYAQIVE